MSHCLVRVLKAGNNDASTHACAEAARLETYKIPQGKQTYTGKRLVLPLKAVSGVYKVLLFPYRDGGKPPVTIWRKDRAGIAAEWDGQRDKFDLTAGEDGRTRLTLKRDGQEVAKMQ